MPYRNQFAGIGEETTWGTAVARTVFSKVFPDSYVRRRYDRQPEAFLGERFPSSDFPLPKKGEFSLRMPLMYSGHDKWFKHLLGSTVDSGGPTYIHTHKVAEAPDHTAAGYKGLTIENHMDLPTNPSMIGEGARPTRAILTVRQGEEPTIEVQGVCEAVNQGAVSGAPTFADMATLRVFPSQVSVTVNAVSYAVRGVVVDINMGYDVETAALGSDTISAPVPGSGSPEVTVALELLDWNATLADLIASGTFMPVVITMTGPTGPPAYSITITLPKVSFQGEEPGSAEGGRLPWTLTGSARHDATDSAIKIVTNNATATT